MTSTSGGLYRAGDTQDPAGPFQHVPLNGSWMLLVCGGGNKNQVPVSTPRPLGEDRWHTGSASAWGLVISPLECPEIQILMIKIKIFLSEGPNCMKAFLNTDNKKERTRKEASGKLEALTWTERKGSTWSRRASRA